MGWRFLQRQPYKIRKKIGKVTILIVYFSFLVYNVYIIASTMERGIGMNRGISDTYLNNIVSSLGKKN